MRGQIDRGLADPGADDEPQARLVQLEQVRRRQHPGIGDHHHVGEVVAGPERPDDRDDRVGLSLVARETADLQREPATVDQQTHNDLRIHPALVGVPDLAQVVFLVRLEVQRRDVIEHQRDVPAGGGVGEAQGGELIAVLTNPSPTKGAFHRRVAGRHPAQVRQNATSVQQRGRFHDPGDHQVRRTPHRQARRTPKP